MSNLLERMSGLIDDFVRRKSQDEGVVGVLVFGSFVSGKVRMTSDLDLLVVGEDVKEWSRTRRRERGILLEIHTWPLKLFGKPFLGETGDLLSDAFRFEVMRTGRILYDPKGILQQFKRYAQTHQLPPSHMKLLVERVHKSLRLAQNLLERRELEGAELEIRRAAEELARVTLLEKDVLEINPPKTYLPHLRNEAPDFYSTFREVHNLKNLQRNEIIATIQNISKWLERTVEEIRRTGKEDWLKAGGPISGAQTQLSNAQDCLENGDLEAAALQARYSAILVTSSILRLQRGASSNAPGTRYTELLQSRHPYGDVMTSVMDFSHNERKLKEYIEILEKIVKRNSRTQIIF